MPTCCVYGCRSGYKYSQTRGNISDGNTRQQRIRRIHRDNFPPNDAVTACALFIFVKLTLLRPLAKTPTSDENADLSNYSDDIWKPPPCPLCLKLCKAIFPLNRRTKDIFQIVRCGFPWTDCECHEVFRAKWTTSMYNFLDFIHKLACRPIVNIKTSSISFQKRDDYRVSIRSTNDANIQ